MSASGSVTFDWGDGRYTFRLDIGDLRELQENPNVGVGPIALFRRISVDQWKADDIPEVIRLALIRGSNIAPVKAMKLVQRYYHEANKIDGKEAALRVLHAYLLWPEDDPVGKTEAAKDAKTAQKATNSPSPPSTNSGGA
jgi:tail tube GTA-gp10-like protein